MFSKPWTLVTSPNDVLAFMVPYQSFQKKKVHFFTWRLITVVNFSINLFIPLNFYFCLIHCNHFSEIIITVNWNSFCFFLSPSFFTLVNVIILLFYVYFLNPATLLLFLVNILQYAQRKIIKGLPNEKLLLPEP